MLDELTIKAIKSFSHAAKVKFSPITVISGTNSSGKSTILQTILLLKQSFESPVPSLAGIVLNGRHTTAGSYEDWSSEHKRAPVSIILGIRNAWRVPNEQIERAFSPRSRTRYLHGNYWWRERTTSAEPVEQTNGALTVELEGIDDAPSVAQITNLSWHSKVIRGESKATYTLSLAMADDKPTDADLDSPLDPAEREAFPYWVTTTEVRTDSPPTSTAEATPTRVRCAIEGLLPGESLAKTALQAEERSVRQATTRALIGIVDHVLGEPGLALFSSEQRDANHQISRFVNATNKVFKRVSKFIAESSDQEFLNHVASNPWLANCLMDVFNYGSARIPAQQQLQRGVALTEQYISRLEGFLPGVNLDIEHGLDDNIALLLERHPHWSQVLRLVRAFLLKQSGRASEVRRSNAAELLSRAATECRQRRLLMLPRAVRFRPTLKDELVCPSIDGVRNFLVDSVFYLGPLREEPRNLYSTEPVRTPDDVGRRGERAISCLRQFGMERIYSPKVGSSQPALETQTLNSAVLQWGRYLGIFDGLNIDATSKYGTVCKITAKGDEARIQSDLTNVGVGVSQLLPVLVLCLAARLGSTILIEQPELHLHPSLQSKLAEFLAACALTGRQIVVETHSEHFVNRLRLMVAEGRLDSARDISIVFAERDEFGTSLRSVGIRRDGGLDSWPKGFFDEAEATLAAILKHRLNDQG